MQYVYSYHYEIPLLKNSLDELENDVMFNDELKLYKGFKNKVKFRVRDRDRKTVDLDTRTVKITIVSDYTDLVVSTFYLSVENDGKNLTVTLLPSDLRDIDEGTGYTFIASLEGAEGEDAEILYIDHDFNVKVPVSIIQPVRVPIEIKLEDTIVRENNFDRMVEGEFAFKDYIYNDANFLKLLFYNTNPDVPVDVILQKHRKKYYPVSTDHNVQWTDDQKFFDVGIDPIEFDLKKWAYYRVIVLTYTPDDVYVSKLVVDKHY